jgi:hypothetical protein
MIVPASLLPGFSQIEFESLRKIPFGRRTKSFDSAAEAASAVRRQNWTGVLPLGRSADFQSSFPESCVLIRSLRSAGIKTPAIALTAYARHEEADEAHVHTIG